MITKLVRENAKLRAIAIDLNMQLNVQEDVADNLRSSSARCVISLIQSMGNELQDTPMDAETNSAVLEWLSHIDPTITNLDELIQDFDEDVEEFEDFDDFGETTYNHQNRISHLFDEDEDDAA